VTQETGICLAVVSVGILGYRRLARVRGVTSGCRTCSIRATGCGFDVSGSKSGSPHFVQRDDAPQVDDLGADAVGA
jgi:hypothetical protein